MNISFVRQTLVLIQKDLRRELRTKEILTTTVAFSVLLMVIFTFAFYQDEKTVSFVFPGILWVSIAFAGTLAIGRTFAQEKEDGCLRALALVPSTDSSLFYGKLLINLMFLFVFEAVLLPLLGLAFSVDILSQLGIYVATLVCGTLGFAALGTLLSAMLVHSRLREVLLPIVLYPLAVPLVIAGVKMTALTYNGADFAQIWSWFKALIAMDAVFIGMGQFLFRWVLTAIE